MKSVHTFVFVQGSKASSCEAVKLRENVQMKRIREKAEEWTGKTEWMSGVNGQIANCC